MAIVEGGKLLPELAAAYASRKALNSRDLENMTHALAERYEHLLVVVDALDEVPEDNSGRQDVLDGLQTLSGRNPGTRFLMTSRPDADIADFMYEWQFTALPIDDGAVNADIDLHVMARLNEDRRFRAKEWSTQMRKEVLDTFQQKAQGMFRWAACQLEDLATIKIHSPKYIRARLTALPKTLPATYERLFGAIEDDYIEAARYALTWLAFAERELTLHELEDTYIIQPGTTPVVDEENRAPPGSIVRVLKSLVVVAAPVEVTSRLEISTDDSKMSDPLSNVDLTPSESPPSDEDMDVQRGNDTKVRLAHYSVKEYLMSNLIRCSPVSSFALSAHEGHKHIVQCCLAYLVYHEELIWQACAERKARRHDRHGPSRALYSSRTALLQYIANFWHRHEYTVELTDDSNANIVATFLCTHRELLRVVMAIRDGTASSIIRKATYKEPTGLPLNIAMSKSLGPLRHTLRALCAAGEDINAHNPLYGSALTKAIRKRDETMVSTLIQFGADVNLFCESQLENRTNPLLLACSQVSWNPKVVRLLVEAGADVNVCTEAPGLPRRFDSKPQNATPLSEALYESPRRKRDADKRNGPIQTLLCGGRGAYWRCRPDAEDRYGVVDTLLRYGADVRKQAGKDGSLLVAAVRYGDARLISRLLEAGALINDKGHERYPLEEAVRYCNSEAFKLLLEAGADPTHGWKAILDFFLCNEGRPEACAVVTKDQIEKLMKYSSYLLASKISLDADLASDALRPFAWNGCPELVSLLLPLVADVNHHDDRAGTPLYEAERELKWRCDISEPHYDPAEETLRFQTIIDLLRAKSAVSLSPFDRGQVEDCINERSQIHVFSAKHGRTSVQEMNYDWIQHHVVCSSCDRGITGVRFKCLTCPSADDCWYCSRKIYVEHHHDFVAAGHPRQLRHTLIVAKRMLLTPNLRQLHSIQDGENVVIADFEEPSSLYAQAWNRVS
ncbi:hypothetical protein LTR15_009257 [Elasticomyces elasticus]|nr:hypothetical protein LTR15_009257 [Elasticomyces elasticus]